MTSEVHQKTSITHAKLLSISAAFLHGERPPDDDDGDIGPFGPVIRQAAQDWLRNWAFSSEPEINNAAITQSVRKHPGEIAALNPQPLPPRHTFLTTLADTVITRAELMHEIGNSLSGDAEKRGIIIVSGYVRGFAEELKKQDFRLGILKLLRLWRCCCHRWCRCRCRCWRFEIPELVHQEPPFPPGPNPLTEELSGLDLIVLGTAFAAGARRTFDRKLRGVFDDAAAQFAAAGVERMP